MQAGDVWKFLSLGFLIVLVGICLKDASSVNTILTGAANSYSTVLGTLEKAG